MNASSTQIRKAQEKDLPQLVQLCHAHAIFEEAEYFSEGKVDALKEFLFGANPSAHCLVVADGNQLLGYATYMKQFATWDASSYIYMDCLFMVEEARGRGLGEDLVNAIKEAAKELNCATIQWQTPDFNTRAIKFYKRIGASAKSKERFFLTA